MKLEITCETSMSISIDMTDNDGNRWDGYLALEMGDWTLYRTNTHRSSHRLCQGRVDWQNALDRALTHVRLELAYEGTK
jgi:hypothetical protein